MKTTLSILILFIVSISSQAQTNNAFDIILGIDRTYRNVNTTDDSPLAEQLLSSVEDEEAKFNWRFGANYRKGYSEKNYLKLGARISSLGYKRNYDGLRFGSQHDGMGGFDPDLDPDAPNDAKVYTNYLFFELPISFGVIQRKDKFSFFAEAGVSPNIYLTTRTKTIFDADPSTDSQRDPNVRSANISALLAVGVSYHINDNFSIFGQPSFRYHFTTLVKDTVLKEYLYSYGVEFGLRREL